MTQPVSLGLQALASKPAGVCHSELNCSS